MTILKKYNLQDIIKNIKKKNQNKFLSKKKLIRGGKGGAVLEEKFNEIIKIFDPDLDFIINSFKKLKELEGKYDAFNKKLEEINKLVDNKTKFKFSNIPNYSLSNAYLITKNYLNEINTKYNKFYNGNDIASDPNYKIYAYKNIYGDNDTDYNAGTGEFTKLKKDFEELKNFGKDASNADDGVVYYNKLFLFINRIYLILINEKFKQYKFFTFKNTICEKLLISEKYNNIGNIIYYYFDITIANIKDDITVNEITIIGKNIENTIKEIDIIKNYFKKYDEIIKNKIMNCEKLNEIPINIINKDYYEENLFQTNNNNIIYDKQKIDAFLNSEIFNKYEKIKIYAILSYTFYYDIYNYKINDKIYYTGLIENIEPKFNYRGNINLLRDNYYLKYSLKSIQRDIDKNIKKFCYKYLYKSKINPIIDIIEDIEKNIEIIKTNIEEIYKENKYKGIKNKDDFDYEINLQEYNYYISKFRDKSDSAGGGYLYSNENNDEKNIRDNAINIMREINNFVPIFTGGGDNKTENFIKYKVSLLEENIRTLEEKIEKIKKNDYDDLEKYNNIMYFENTELHKLLTGEKKQELLKERDELYKRQKDKHDKIYKLKTEFDKVTLELKKIIERNITSFLESKKLDEDIKKHKPKKVSNSENDNANSAKVDSDNGDNGNNGGNGDNGNKGIDANTDGNETLSSDKKSTDFKIILDIFNMVFVVLIIIIYLIYISACCISLLNIIIYIVMVIYDILMNIFNDDMTIYETFGYKILKYIDVQITYKKSDKKSGVDNTESLKILEETKAITDVNPDYKIIFNFMNLESVEPGGKLKQIIKDTDDSISDFNAGYIAAQYTLAIRNLKEDSSPDKMEKFVTQFNDAKNRHERYEEKRIDSGNYENFEKNENSSDLNKEPYFFALIEQNIIYIITNFLTLILFLIIFLFIIFIFFTIGAYLSSKKIINGLNNNKTKKILLICSVFLIFITISIVLYKYLFSDTIFDKLANIKEQHNDIDRIIFSYLYINNPTRSVDLQYCNDLKTNIGDLDIIDGYFKTNEGVYLDPKDINNSKKIKQQAFLYNLYLYLQEIVPTSNKTAISLIHEFFTATDNNNIRDNGYLSFASFLSNTGSANPIQKYYNNLGIFNDDTFLSKTAEYDRIKTSLNNQIKNINKVLLKIPELKETLLLLGLYFLINLILKFIGLILISYLIAKDKDLAPEFRLFPEELSKFLANILYQIPYLNDLLYIYKDGE